jgi:hypothetical protein
MNTSNTVFQADLEATRDYLWRVLRMSADNLQQVDAIAQKIEKLNAEFTTRNFYLLFASANRFIDKERVRFTYPLLFEAPKHRAGFYPEFWTHDQLIRVLLLLYLPYENEAEYLKTLNQLFETGEMSELVALYSALPLLPHPALHLNRAMEGIRSNIAPVFEAIALNNPYPKDYFSESAWNQLFLKAIFTEKKIWQIQGIAERANADLARICSDYAHERWAAGRVVTPELWQPVTKFVNDLIINDLEKLFLNPEPNQAQAAALVCLQSDHPKAKNLLIGKESLVSEIEQAKIDWLKISQLWWENKKN